LEALFTSNAESLCARPEAMLYKPHNYPHIIVKTGMDSNGQNITFMP